MITIREAIKKMQVGLQQCMLKVGKQRIRGLFHNIF